MSEWRHTTLGSKVELITGFPFKSNQYTDDIDGIRLLRGDNIVQGNLRWENVKRWKAYDPTIDPVYQLCEGDVVVAMDRPWIEAGLKFSVISRFDLPCLLVQRVACLRASEELSNTFLRYLIASREFTQHILSVETGTAVPHVSGAQIKEFTFRCPTLSEQQAIAQVLSSLDDKIDLLHRQNKTLEAIAETLFRQWFIEDAQDDWEEKSLLDVIQVINGGTPKTSIPEYWNGDIPWLSGGDITSSHKSFVLSSVKTITQDGLDYSSAKLLPRFATVITARGTVGKYALLSKPIAYSQSNFVSVCKFSPPFRVSNCGVIRKESL